MPLCQNLSGENKIARWGRGLPEATKRVFVPDEINKKTLLFSKKIFRKYKKDSW